jgi:hypothetical protein
MAKLLFLIIVFILAVGLSFYFSAEGFEVIDVVALKAELEDLTKSIDYLNGLGLNETSGNATYDANMKRIKEIKTLLAAPASVPAPVPASVPASVPAPVPTVVQPIEPSRSLVDSSGNKVSTPPPGVTTDASGNLISNRLKDLISIMTQPAMPVVAANTAKEQQGRESVPASASDNMGGTEQSLASFYQTMKPQIQQDISQAVRQEFERSTVLPKAEQQQQQPTPAIAQGIAWPYGPGGKAQPDMSEYIRKDSIPCWACDVKY